MAPTALVVDEDAATRRLVAVALAPRGVRLLEAATVTEALDLLRREHPHLVLLDLVLPPPAGLQVCLQIASDLAWCGTAVVVLTSDPRRETHEHALAAGAADVVVKPFSAADLLTRVDRLLEREA